MGKAINRKDDLFTNLLTDFDWSKVEVKLAFDDEASQAENDASFLKNRESKRIPAKPSLNQMCA